MSHDPNWTVLYTTRGGLLEAPRQYKRNELLFSDAKSGGVYSIGSDLSVRTVLAHRRGIGGLAMQADDSLLVTGRNLAHKVVLPDGDARSTVLLADGPGLAISGFNDLGVDSLGRVYAGALSPSEGTMASGKLILLDLDGTATVVVEDVAIPNGVAFSPDGSVLYLVDSGRRVVVRYVVDRATGRLREPRPFPPVDEGVPDGLAVASDGSVWVAQAYAGRIIRFSSLGEVVDSWNLPDLFVTSLCFGADHDPRIYVTTGAQDPGDEAKIYTAEVDVSGTPVHLGRVAPPQ